MADFYKNILVAVDGSDQSEKAFEESVAIALRNEAKLIIIRIINDVELSTSAYAFSRLLDDEKVLAEGKVAEKVRIAKEAGVKEVVSLVDIGSPRQFITEIIPKKLPVDLVVMGATGKGAIQRALIGSTTDYVVDHAPCNVMVVK